MVLHGDLLVWGTFYLKRTRVKAVGMPWPTCPFSFKTGSSVNQIKMTLYSIPHITLIGVYLRKILLLATV